jgi:hypothetical protein
MMGLSYLPRISSMLYDNMSLQNLMCNITFAYIILLIESLAFYCQS